MSRARDEARRESSAWYSDGLRFTCTQCGNCCSGPPGAVWVTTDEENAIAAELGLDRDEFLRRFTRLIGAKRTLTERRTEHGADCVFLDRASVPGKALCSIYGARPEQCRTWPFWPENLGTRDAWESAKRRTPCPGMDSGAWHSYVEISISAGAQADAALNPPPSEARGRGTAAAAAVEGVRVESDDSLPRAWRAAITRPDVVAALTALHDLVASETAAQRPQCIASGRCCHFDEFDHRLFVTGLEAAWCLAERAAHGAPPTSARDISDARARGDCPYLLEGRTCGAHRERPLGCRIYFCDRSAKDWQQALYERVHRELVALHERFDIPYRYGEWREMLAAASPPPRGE